MKPPSKWRDRAVMLMPPLPWDRPQLRDSDGPLVVLLHGLWRGWRAMEPLSRALGNEGFATLNIPYPSSRLPIPVLAERVGKEIEKVANERPVHLITHSLGGIIARSLIAEALPWQLGRVVMLAPPNGGSEIVDWTSRHPLLRRMLGPAGQALGSQGLPNQLPALPAGTEVAVIMGNRSPLPVFKNLLEKTNDGIVSASRGNLHGLSEFTIIDADHTFIQMHPDAIRLSLEFLKSGKWSTEPTHLSGKG